MSDEPKKQDREEEQRIARAWFTIAEINAWAAKYLIKTWQQRCEEHPDHNGIVTNRMIQARMQEEIDDLRAAIERPWQGLTDEELDAMRQESKLDFVTLREFREVARSVEAKLKERNT